MSDELVRHTDFYPAWGTVPPGDIGIHSVTLRFALSGPLGAVHFSLYTGWHLPEVHKHLEIRADAASLRHHGGLAASKILTKPIPVDVGYHSPVATDGAEEAHECDLLPGGECYGSGNMLRARDFYETLTREGSEGIWKRLEGEYRIVFTTKQAEKAMGVTDEMDGTAEVSEEKVQDEG